MTGALSSWNDGAARQAILVFVGRACGDGLVLHDDGKREFDYTSGAEQALEQAGNDDWTIVSMKNDWATVF